MLRDELKNIELNDEYEILKQFSERFINQKDIEPEFAEFVNDNFNELLDNA